MNASFQLTRVNNTTALVSKKDQVVKTQWNGSDYINNEIIEAEGNYFYKGTSTGSKSFIVNSTRSGIECFNAASTPEATIHIGYPVNNIVANTTGNKLYMFHKQNSENTGLFVHNTETGETVNLNTDDNDFNNITGMIGDVVYNPYKKQFLVAQSNFASGTYNIKIINDDADNSSPGVIPLPTGVEYPKEMYIGPDKKLYIMANMQSGSQNPKVCVDTADDSETHDAYELIENYNGDISFSGTFADDFEYWSARFCYNAANNKVYATIHPTEYTLDPYVSVPNSMFNYDEPMLTTGEGTGTGSIVRFDNTHVQSITSDFFFPGKIICPNESSGETNSQYADKIFVIGEDFYEYDFVNPTNTITHEGLSYNDIIYSPELDMLFAMRDKRNPDCSADRRIQIDKIYYDNGVLKFEQIDLDGDGADGWLAGQAAGFFYNPYDMNIYIHLKFDNKKLGGTNVSLIRFDPSEANPSLDIIDLGMTSFYPELDHCPDYHSYFYNINQPYINSICYNNYPAEFYLANEFPEGESSRLEIYNSLIDGGEEDIRIITSGNELFYDNQTNIDTDPLFLGKWEHPYQIADGSPCIDAGTLANLPDFIELPEFDLAGNPRIVGDSIDMGAYEWNPTVGVDENIYQPIQNKKPKLLKAAPNPFSTSTTLSAKWDFTGHVQIEIYNNAGLRVKVLKSGRSGGMGSIQTKWDGKDQNGNMLPAGIYHVVIFWEGKEIEGMKVVKQ
ncbi:MAG: hypothetical protein L3J66_03645 [Bacteroidales bacterium]|nr:hypothetical protein [Bacteroidales bacterium]